MEVLSETTHYASFIGALVILIGFSLIMVGLGIGTIVMGILEKRFTEKDGIGSFICLAMAALFFYISFIVIDNGANTTIKAIVTDYNEVYDNGYKVIGEEGKITLLQKVNKD